MSERKSGKQKVRVTPESPKAVAPLSGTAGKESTGSASPKGSAALAANGTANSTGTSNDEATAPYCTSLINLEVKVLTQALGAENQWVERGDGTVEFADFTIRVIAAKSSQTPSIADGSATTSPDGGRSGGTCGGASSSAADSSIGMKTPGAEEATVLLEDTITSETPFVGENCCIVWNSFEQQLSLCLMYASENGYAASWSALVALQDKAYPPFHTDLLSHCLPVNERAKPQRSGDGDADGAEESGDDAVAAAVDKSTEDLLPPGVLAYSYFIHDKYEPPLGFIESHALSLCIIEHGHASRRELYAERDTVLTLLNLANGDLLEHLLTSDVYVLLLEGLGHATDSEAEGGWCVPSGLAALTVPEELTQIISKDMRLTHLQRRVLRPVDIFTELILKLSTISHRLRNELTCSLLSSDVTLQQAREALMVQPPITASAAAAVRNRQSIDGIFGTSAAAAANGASGSGSSSMNGPSAAGLGVEHTGVSNAGGSTADVIESCVRAERQVLAHLHFFRSLVSLSIAELGKELVGPVVVKVFQSGLLEALSLVAERFAMPSGAAHPFASGLPDGGGSGNGNSGSGGGGAPGASGNSSSSSQNRRVSTTTPNWYSAAVEAELTMLLDVTLVRLNERQEEQLMNELVRTPILADPLKYNGIVTFMLRQLALGNAGAQLAAAAVVHSASPPRPGTQSGSQANTAPFGLFSPLSAVVAGRSRVLHEDMSTRNPYVLFHVLGLHDDEGSAAAERALDPESTDIRNRFHNFIITKYLFQVSRGSLVPVPLPPAGGTSKHKSSPIIQFSNAAVAYNLPQGISPPFIRVLEYLINLSTTENREALLKVVFNHKSHIMHYIESCCELASVNPRSIGIDVLSRCMRFLRTVLSQMAVPETEKGENPMVLFTLPPEPISKTLITTMCRHLTVERDTFGIVLRTYHRIGGTRRNTIFHSAVLSLLELIDHHVPAIKDSSNVEDLAQVNNDLRDIRDYLFLKHPSLLPARFERKFRESLLSEVSSRLGRDTCTPNDSVSVLSSTASEMLRSSSRLRFVDEVEAATGGVDGTVVPESVSRLGAVVVGNMHSPGEKLSMKLRNAMELLGSGGPGGGSGGHLRVSSSSPVGSPGSSPPGVRPGGGTGSSGNSPVLFRSVSPPLGSNLSVGHGASGVQQQPSPPAGAHLQHSSSGGLTPLPTGGGSGGRLNPVMPSYEKPVVRPRSGRSSSEILTEAARQGGTSGTPEGSSMSAPTQAPVSAPASSSSSPPPMLSTPGAKHGAASGGSPGGSGEMLLLPKIRKRAAAVSGRR